MEMVNICEVVMWLQVHDFCIAAQGARRQDCRDVLPGCFRISGNRISPGVQASSASPARASQVVPSSSPGGPGHPGPPRRCFASMPGLVQRQKNSGNREARSSLVLPEGITASADPASGSRSQPGNFFHAATSLLVSVSTNRRGSQASLTEPCGSDEEEQQRLLEIVEAVVETIVLDYGQYLQKPEHSPLQGHKSIPGVPAHSPLPRHKSVPEKPSSRCGGRDQGIGAALAAYSLKHGSEAKAAVPTTVGVARRCLPEALQDRAGQPIAEAAYSLGDEHHSHVCGAGGTVAVAAADRSIPSRPFYHTPNAASGGNRSSGSTECKARSHRSGAMVSDTASQQFGRSHYCTRTQLAGVLQQAQKQVEESICTICSMIADISKQHDSCCEAQQEISRKFLRLENCYNSMAIKCPLD